MLEFLIDSIFVSFAGILFQQVERVFNLSCDRVVVNRFEKSKVFMEDT
jgi:hypothetical protein